MICSAESIGDRREIDPRKTVKFYGARAHNLKGIDVEIPLNMMVAVTGVSGSGKSTLVHDVIFQSLTQRLRKSALDGFDEDQDRKAEKLTCRRVDRAELVHEVVLVDQSPIGRTPRSNPVTYIKAFDLIREIFASTPEAAKRGYNGGHFSFNIPGGRCENCQGDGTVTVEMQFLADVELMCEECKGTRFKSAILDIRYKGLNIHEVLKLTVKEALSFFSRIQAPGESLEGSVRCRAGLLAAGPVRHHAERRRSPAREIGIAPGAGHLRAARSSSSMSPPPACTSTTSPSCWAPFNG